MARIRTIKPEFWDDEAVGLLSREARLLFLASLNLADDEGLLRWTAAFLKSSAFVYDDDITVSDTEAFMDELTESGMVMPYRGGKAQQRLAWIVNFHKHQKINRPSPPKLPAPSLLQPKIARVYARRDNELCHLCNEPVVYATKDSTVRPSLDHVQPRSKGGSDYPSNIRLAHIGCNAAKKDHIITVPYDDSPCDTIPLDLSVSGSVSGSVNDSREEGKGKGREGKGRDFAPAVRERRPVWDALEHLFGKPITPTQQKLYGRINRNIGAAMNGHPDPYSEVLRRAAAIVKLWDGVSKLTPTSLEKHWSRFDGEVGAMSDVEAQRTLEAAELRQWAESESKALEAGT